MWHSMALLKSPCDSYAHPRFAYAHPRFAYARPPPPCRPPPLQSPSPACSTRWPWNRPPAKNTRCRGSPTPRPPSPDRPPPLRLSGAPCDTRWPWTSPPKIYTRCRGCSRETKQRPASKSARRLLPPWPRTPALPRPASRQHRQAALVSPTLASGQPSASLPCGCQRAQRPRTRAGVRPSTP